MADEEFHLNGQGTAEAVEETESLEEWQTAHKKLSELKGQDGQLTSMTKQDMSLLKGLDAGPKDTKDRYTDVLRHANFISEDEMWDHINAYNEAVDLGMDTEFNIQAAEGLKGTNRKGGFRTNQIGTILDALSHQKYTSNQPRSSERGSANPRSPLS